MDKEPQAINKGAIVQTRLYAHGNYLGRKIKVIEVQADIEPGNETIKGIALRKDGSEGKTHHELTLNQLTDKY